MFEDLLSRLVKKDRLALARLLTLAVEGGRADVIRSRLGTPAKRARVVAVTGNSGVGKSSLVGRLIEVIRRKGKSVAVLACDPESSLTGGALLGDRVRMPALPDDEWVFIRSLAAASGGQAVVPHLDVLRTLLETFGFDVIVIETVGAGQGDTAVRDVADVVVLLLQPEAGDDFQWEKAGLLEVADVVVIHKSDLAGSAKVEAQVRSLLNLPGCREIPIVRASAATNEGVEALWDRIELIPAADRKPDKARVLLQLAQQRLSERFELERESIEALVKEWTEGKRDADEAADLLLRFLANGEELPSRRRETLER